MYEDDKKLPVFVYKSSESILGLLRDCVRWVRFIVIRMAVLSQGYKSLGSRML